jgi:hypothetical protein
VSDPYLLYLANKNMFKLKLKLRYAMDKFMCQRKKGERKEREERE